MLLTVLVLAAVFLSATVIAGLLMVYQLNQITNVVDSTRAIYAADAGVERALFQIFRCNSEFGSGAVLNPFPPPPAGPFPPLKLLPLYGLFCDPANIAQWLPTFSNGASVKLEIFDQNANCQTLNYESTSADICSIRTTGRSGKSARSFEVFIQ